MTNHTNLNVILQTLHHGEVVQIGTFAVLVNIVDAVGVLRQSHGMPSTESLLSSMVSKYRWPSHISQMPPVVTVPLLRLLQQWLVPRQLYKLLFLCISPMNLTWLTMYYQAIFTIYIGTVR